ncbi:Siderochrome iron transporter 2 [Limtongia smithiae]|uniref:Siderochrome iron transporter 2 n=1 Tax=Limtongia smithiae TaxID=1125753 RepID=UPI0034CE5C4E
MNVHVDLTVIERLDEIKLTTQIGVQKAEAITLIRSKTAMIWLCFFILSLQSSIRSNVIYWISQADILAAIISGILELPISRILISCNDPNSFAAGYILFYWLHACQLHFQHWHSCTHLLKRRLYSPPFLVLWQLKRFLIIRFVNGLYRNFVIIIFAFYAPLASVKFCERKTRKMGLFVRASSGPTKLQSIIHYFMNLIIGASLLIAAFVLVLPPFDLEIYHYAGYKSTTFIALIIVVVVLFPVFAARERYGAKIVVSSVFFRSWISRTKRFKNMCLYFGMPLMMLRAGLMVLSQGSESIIGYLIMHKIFVAFGGSTFEIGGYMAMTSISDHEGISVTIAVLSLSGSVGGTIGYATAAAIYNNTFPLALYNALPDSSKTDYLVIYLDASAAQMLNAMGSDRRNTVNYAWTVTVASVAFILPLIAVWKNNSVKQN